MRVAAVYFTASGSGAVFGQTSASRAEERAAATSITISPSIGNELGRHWQRERMGRVSAAA